VAPGADRKKQDVVAGFLVLTIMGNLCSAYKMWLNGVPIGMLPQYYREYKADLDHLREEPRKPGRRPRNTNPVVATRMMKTNAAAAYLGVSAWKLRNLVQSGEISFIPGDSTSPWLFDKQELDHWIETRKQKL